MYDAHCALFYLLLILMRLFDGLNLPICSKCFYFIFPPQTWPFMVAGKPENELKEMLNTTRLCGTTAS